MVSVGRERSSWIGGSLCWGLVPGEDGNRGSGIGRRWNWILPLEHSLLPLLLPNHVRETGFLVQPVPLSVVIICLVLLVAHWKDFVYTYLFTLCVGLPLWATANVWRSEGSLGSQFSPYNLWV